MYGTILIRFGELSTKGKNKMSFVRQLEKNMKKLMGVEPEVLFDRMFLEYSEENMEGLQRIFGISSYSPVVTVETEMGAIEDAALKLAQKFPEAKTFKIAARRHWKKFEKTSQELNGLLGGHILSNTDLTVNVKKPDLKIEVEVRNGKSYVFCERVQGLGGYPVGINGRVLHLISGGIDSPVAAYELMKRGLRVDYLSFITPPFTDNKTREKISEIVNLLNKYQGKSYIYRLTYTDLMHTIGLTSKQSYKITLMRRSFYRIASKIAESRGYLAIANGENIGQVASQTLESIHTIQEQATLPVLRPILTADKIETINKGIKIGTYEISIVQASETCELFAPKAPVTKPTPKEAYKLEEEFGNLLELEDECMEQMEIERIEL
ncbi:tRNA uracil 4-sulfurtransferase ThiI [Mycoplasma todarodis]|uniref:Probable tRNA sulfurtransferase n=1 Tax=Mycoplasma todarodis TaxID=1937191 RepID=A0A4R0XNU9_9MOLU|nr:tRNA uracil 4-sulfurtransferase ThiI [Mycoplasma todarodis]TCG10635.1 tRNA 4-thiouridine(8) synthase ThiI [Mycoplasma todarodis]